MYAHSSMYFHFLRCNIVWQFSAHYCAVRYISHRPFVCSSSVAFWKLVYFALVLPVRTLLKQMQIFKLELNRTNEQNKLDRTQTNGFLQIWLHANAKRTDSVAEERKNFVIHATMNEFLLRRAGDDSFFVVKCRYCDKRRETSTRHKKTHTYRRRLHHLQQHEQSLCVFTKSRTWNMIVNIVNTPDDRGNDTKWD